MTAPDRLPRRLRQRAAADRLNLPNEWQHGDPTPARFIDWPVVPPKPAEASACDSYREKDAT